MVIQIGQYEYTIVPGTIVQETNNKINFQIIGEGINLSDFELILQDKNNTNMIQTSDNNIEHIYYNYTKLDNLEKKYHVVYAYKTKDIIVEPTQFDPWSGDIITPAQHRTIQKELFTDIIYVTLLKPEMIDQVELNAANIEFIAIMSDIEL